MHFRFASTRYDNQRRRLRLAPSHTRDLLLHLAMLLTAQKKGPRKVSVSQGGLGSVALPGAIGCYLAGVILDAAESRVFSSQGSRVEQISNFTIRIRADSWIRDPQKTTSRIPVLDSIFSSVASRCQSCSKEHFLAVTRVVRRQDMPSQKSGQVRFPLKKKRSRTGLPRRSLASSLGASRELA